MPLTFATRPSTLARGQTMRVIQLLRTAHPGLECREHVIPTAGDQVLDRLSPEMSGHGLFTAELEAALLSGEVDAVVHSLKDLPVEGTPGIVIAALPEREVAYDVLVSAQAWTLSDLPEGARVGACSLRRTAQLLACRPDLTILPVRGDIETRVENVRCGEYDAIVLAQAGLIHLGLQAHISQVFSLDVMLPAPGQGALAVQCRADHPDMQALLAAIHHPETAAAVHAERAFLSALGGDCSLPVAAYGEYLNGSIILTGAVISTDGKKAIRLSAVDTDPGRLGERLAALVLERGAAELLKANA